jgi:hypothetical protein
VVHVAGLSEYKVDSYDEVLERLLKGQMNRKTEATNANNVSSRSHAVLQFTILHHKKSRSGHGGSTVESKLSLVDLAGSERASATLNSGVRMQESANINKSLLALANCINALSERSVAANMIMSPRKSVKKTNHNVKYRDSKLTHLLKGSLEGNCNLVMIANVNPADSTYDDTYRTLQYANRAKRMTVKAVTKETDVTTAAERELQLKDENEELRLRLAQVEQTVHQMGDSEQQLLQALSRALEALNEQKGGVAGAGVAAAGGGNNRDSISSVLSSAQLLLSQPPPAPAAAGKSNKRDSTESGFHNFNNHNRRSSASSTYSRQIYDDNDDDGDEENNERGGNQRQKLIQQSASSSSGPSSQHQSQKSRRLSTESSPRGGRDSTASTYSASAGRGGRDSIASTYSASAGRDSVGSTRRLSTEIVRQCEAFATATTTFVNQNILHSHNNVPEEEGEDELLKGASADTARAFKVDARYQYNTGSNAASSSPVPKKKGFFSRYLCGVGR